MATFVRLANQENEPILINLDRVLWILNMGAARPGHTLIVWDADAKPSADEFPFHRTIVKGSLDQVEQLMRAHRS